MRILRTVAALAALVLLTACGSDGSSDGAGGASPPEKADLEASTYTSNDVSGHQLVEGSTITLSFQEGTMAAKAGCNTMTGEYEVSDGTLRWTGPVAATQMACPTGDLADQDQWLTENFTDGMDATLEEGTLTLTNDKGLRIVLDQSS
jgi:heat shock protein HslJ